MKRSSNTIGISRLMPGIDLGLLLIVLTCGTAGLSWVTAASPETADSNAAMRVSPEDKAKQIADLEKEIEKLRHELDKSEDDAKQLQAALNKTKANSPNLDDSRDKRTESSHDLETLRQHLKDLRSKLRQLQREAGGLRQKKDRLEKLRKDIDDMKIQIRNLAAQLKQKKQEIETLRNDIDEMNEAPIDRIPIKVDFYPVFQAETNRKMVMVLLSQNTVTPVRSPYYAFTRHSNGLRAALVQRGEAIDLAITPGSNFQALLSEIDTKKEYVFLLVDSSSFETFRKVREVLQKRGIPFGWDPSNHTNMNFVSGGEGAVQTGTIK